MLSEIKFAAPPGRRACSALGVSRSPTASFEDRVCGEDRIGPFLLLFESSVDLGIAFAIRGRAASQPCRVQYRLPRYLDTISDSTTISST